MNRGRQKVLLLFASVSAVLQTCQSRKPATECVVHKPGKGVSDGKVYREKEVSNFFSCVSLCTRDFRLCTAAEVVELPGRGVGVCSLFTGPVRLEDALPPRGGRRGLFQLSPLCWSGAQGRATEAVATKTQATTAHPTTAPPEEPEVLSREWEQEDGSYEEDAGFFEPIASIEEGNNEDRSLVGLSPLDSGVEEPGRRVEWTEWSECSVSCGAGHRKRAKLRRGVQAIEERESCLPALCPAPERPSWGGWAVWSSCRASCGYGRRFRARRCSAGDACAGHRLEHQLCHAGRSCLPQWDPWAPWTACTATCGVGTQTRRRACPSASCLGPALATRQCEGGRCEEPEAAWAQWAPWSGCRGSCRGTEQRSRRCSSGGGCGGPLVQSRLCRDERACLREGLRRREWAEWEPWTACSRTCGPGMKERRRRCRGADSGTRFSCGVRYFEMDKCVDKACPLDTEAPLETSTRASRWKISEISDKKWPKTRRSLLKTFLGRSLPTTSSALSTKPPKPKLMFQSDDFPKPRLFIPDNSEAQIGAKKSVSPSSKDISRRSSTKRYISRHPGEVSEVEETWGESDLGSLRMERKIKNRKQNLRNSFVSPFSSSLRRFRLGRGGGSAGSLGVTASPELLPRALENSEIEKDGDPCRWGPWAEWSLCTVSCGRGFRYRGRSCPCYTDCRGFAYQTSWCERPLCPGSLTFIPQRK